MPRNRQMSEEMRSQSQARILAAGRKLFAEQGFFSCKVSDIARQAGMSQGNVYWYFSSKELILEAILREGFDKLEALTREVSEEASPAAVKLNHLAERAVELYRQQSDFTRILGSLMAHGGAALVRQMGFDMLQIGTRYHANLAKLFAAARDQGLVVDLEPHILVMLFFALFNGLAVTYSPEWQGMPEQFFSQAAMRLVGAKT